MASTRTTSSEHTVCGEGQRGSGWAVCQGCLVGAMLGTCMQACQLRRSNAQHPSIAKHFTPRCSSPPTALRP